MDDIDEPGVVVLTVRGHPRPQPRARVMAAGRGVAATAGRQAAHWRQAVRMEAERVVERAGGAWAVQERLGGGKRAIGMELEVRLPTQDAARWGQWHTAPGDADNFAKGMDVLMDAGLLPGDDRIVAELRVRKRWSRPEEGGITVRLAVLEEPGAAEPAAWVRSFEPGWLRG